MPEEPFQDAFSVALPLRPAPWFSARKCPTTVSPYFKPSSPLNVLASRKPPRKRSPPSDTPILSKYFSHIGLQPSSSRWSRPAQSEECKTPSAANVEFQSYFHVHESRCTIDTCETLARAIQEAKPCLIQGACAILNELESRRLSAKSNLLQIHGSS
jgi:hypothetical protein